MEISLLKTVHLGPPIWAGLSNQAQIALVPASTLPSPSGGEAQSSVNRCHWPVGKGCACVLQAPAVMKSVN